MTNIDSIITKTYTALNESMKEEEYYGFTCPLEEVKNTYKVACKDENCSEMIDIEDIQSGDTVFVSEDDESEVYQIKVQ